MFAENGCAKRSWKTAVENSRGKLPWKTAVGIKEGKIHPWETYPYEKKMKLLRKRNYI